MPDSRFRDPTPRDWSDALAALPLETPPAASWAALAARLPPPVAALPHRHHRELRRVAIAAAVMLAVLLPAWWITRPAPPSAPSVAASQAIRSPDTGATPIYGTAVADAPPATGTRAADSMTAGIGIEKDESVAPSATLPAVARPARTVASATHPVAPGPDPLDALYAESAQLEAVLAQLPESRMANAATEALSAGLHDRVASIDVALSHPTLSSDTQADLWRQRVDTLRQLTGVEATQRWQVALGDSRDRPDTAIY